MPWLRGAQIHMGRPAQLNLSRPEFNIIELHTLTISQVQSFG
jgi:hypothetical protein